MHDRAPLGGAIVRALRKGARTEPADVQAHFEQQYWYAIHAAEEPISPAVLERHLALVQENANTYASELLELSPNLRRATKGLRRSAIKRHLKKVDASSPVLDTTMPVGRTLGPDGGAAPFSGASIGFANKAINQDACQRATVRLRYTANPASVSRSTGAR